MISIDSTEKKNCESESVIPLDQKKRLPVMFNKKICECCILFEQIEHLAVLPRDVQPFSHLPPICTIVCSLERKEKTFSERDENFQKIALVCRLMVDSEHTNIAKTW